MNTNEIQTLLTNLCIEMESLWVLTGYKTDGNVWIRPVVITRADLNATLLPNTKKPVRGTVGVNVTTEKPTGDERTLTESLISNSLVDPPPYLRQYQTEEEVEL